ncbi:MAG: hypothetical protein KAS04_02445, partial [Candidatus Aenigmarchaeota archaeon]|nr:hypothetical protein [Candidatus Aenigmarchaeota archaeon]
AIVAIVIASRSAVITPPDTSGIPEEGKTIKDSVINLIRAGVKDHMTLLYNQGGVARPDMSVEFGMFDTSVWLACGETNVPKVSDEIGKGVLAYMRANLENEMEFYGKNVKFDFSDTNYEVDIIKDRVNIKIYLPTEVEDYEIQQPYEISVPTKLYDVLDFSNNFVNDAKSARFFETVTLVSMMHSNPEHENWVPVAGMQMGCGNYLFKTRKQLLPGIKGVIEYTISHVVWNTDALKLAENPFYPINQVGGKSYSDMEVAFAYPPQWNEEIDKHFMFSPDPLRILPKPIIPLIPLCMGPYSVAYTFRYPVIIMVEDPLLNQWFNFAVMVDIENTQPGNCTAEFGKESEYSKICELEAECNAKITVKNSTDDAVEGADVGFYICDIGVTDSNGVVEGKIPCMVSELHVYKQGYRSFGDLYRSDDIADKPITLEKIADNTTIHFRGLDTRATDDGGDDSDGKYVAYSVVGSPEELTEDNFNDNYIVFLSMSPKTPNYFTNEDSALLYTNYDNDGNIAFEVETYGMQPIEYFITATVSEEESGIPVGYINTSIVLGENEENLYVYLPVVTKTDASDIDEPGIDPSEADQMNDVLIVHCGWETPVSTTELTC